MRRRPRQFARVELEQYQHETSLGLDAARRALVRVLHLLLRVDPYGLLGVFDVHAERQPTGWTLYAAELAGWATATWEIDEGEEIVVLHSLTWNRWQP